MAGAANAGVFGREVDRRALLEAVGDMSQVCGIRSFAFDEGAARGVRALQFRDAGGLGFTVLPDRGMDLFAMEYRGIPLNWSSGTDAVAPAFYSPDGWDWLRSFYGGMLVTCGLANVGDGCLDRGAYLPEERFGAHGRLSSTPAVRVAHRARWEGERYLLEASGELVEAAGQGEKFRLSRTIRAEMGGRCVEVRDSVANESFYRLPQLLLYHINVGFPLLDEGARIYAACRGIRGLDAPAEENRARAGAIGRPEPDYPEYVWLLDLAEDREGFCRVVLANPALDGGRGLGLYVRFRKSELPYFNLWQRLARREYVVGFEPGNCTVQGRVRQRERGDLHELGPQETAEYGIEIGVLPSQEEVRRFAAEHGLAAL